MNGFESFKQSIERQFPKASLSEQDIALILGVNQETLYRMRIRKKGPPYFKLGRKILYLKQDFFEWFFSCYSKTNTVKPTQE